MALDLNPKVTPLMSTAQPVDRSGFAQFLNDYPQIKTLGLSSALALFTYMGSKKLADSEKAKDNYRPWFRKAAPIAAALAAGVSPLAYQMWTNTGMGKNTNRYGLGNSIVRSNSELQRKVPMTGSGNTEQVSAYPNTRGYIKRFLTNIGTDRHTDYDLINDELPIHKNYIQPVAMDKMRSGEEIKGLLNTTDMQRAIQRQRLGE
jgi:hypothetical protein